MILRQLIGVLRKDLLVEWRGRARVVALAGYALTLLLLFSFAVGPDTLTLQKHAAGYIWLSVVAVSSLLLTQSFRLETEAGALEGLVLLPVDPRSFFYGKALANWAVLLVLAAIAVPVSAFLFDLHVVAALPLVGALLLGTAGVAAPGTLYAAMTARLAAQQLLLPLLLFPLLIPSVLGAVKATSLAFQGDPMNQAPSWLALLLCFDLVFWSLGGVLFSKVVEE